MWVEWGIVVIFVRCNDDLEVNFFRMFLLVILGECFEVFVDGKLVIF